MLHLISRPLAMAAAVSLVALGGATNAFTEALAAGRVLSLKGQAEAAGTENPRALSPEDDVFIGEAVSTADGSRIRIQLGPSTTLSMGERTRLRIDEFLASAGGEIVLDAGAMLVDKDPNSTGQPLEVNSAFGRIAVRGTQFFVGPSKNVFSVFVARGRVAVSAAGTTVTLDAGEGTDIPRPGAPPTTPVRWGQQRIEAALASVR